MDQPSKLSFILYTELADDFEMLTDQEAGIVIKAVFEYTKTGTVPAFEDRTLQLVFNHIKSTIDRNSEKWETKKERRSQAGKAGAEQRWKHQEQNNAIATDDMAKMANDANAINRMAKMANDSNAINEMANMAVSVNANANVNANVNASVREEEPKAPARHRFVKPTVEEIREYCESENFKADPQQIWDFYESKGWKVGSSPMKDWQAAVRNWEKRDRNDNKNQYYQRYGPAPAPSLPEDRMRL